MLSGKDNRLDAELAALSTGLDLCAQMEPVRDRRYVSHLTSSEAIARQMNGLDPAESGDMKKLFLLCSGRAPERFYAVHSLLPAAHPFVRYVGGLVPLYRATLRAKEVDVDSKAIQSVIGTAS